MENVSHNTSFDEDEAEQLSEDLQRNLLTNEQQDIYYNEVPPREGGQKINKNEHQYSLSNELAQVPYELQQIQNNDGIQGSQLIEGSFINTQPDQSLGSFYLRQKSGGESDIMSLSKSNVTNTFTRTHGPSTDLAAIHESSNDQENTPILGMNEKSLLNQSRVSKQESEQSSASRRKYVVGGSDTVPNKKSSKNPSSQLSRQTSKQMQFEIQQEPLRITGKQSVPIQSGFNSTRKTMRESEQDWTPQRTEGSDENQAQNSYIPAPSESDVTQSMIMNRHITHIGKWTTQQSGESQENTNFIGKPPTGFFPTDSSRTNSQKQSNNHTPTATATRPQINKIEEGVSVLQTAMLKRVLQQTKQFKFVKNCQVLNLKQQLKTAQDRNVYLQHEIDRLQVNSNRNDAVYLKMNLQKSDQRDQTNTHDTVGVRAFEPLIQGSTRNHGDQLPEKNFSTYGNPMETLSSNATHLEFRRQQHDPNAFNSMQEQLNLLLQQCQDENCSKNQIAQQLEQFQTRFTTEVQKVHVLCDDLEKMRAHMDQKISQLTQNEIDNLDMHFQLDSKLRALDIACRLSKDPYKMFQDAIPTKSCSIQTDTGFTDLIQREQKIEVLEQELKVIKFRQTAEFQARDNQLESRQRDIEIRERLTEEQRIEFQYKREQLNQQIKGQLVWPLNCLENDNKLMQRFKNFKMTPDSLKTQDADSNFELFLQREENLQLTKELSGDFITRIEGLLHFEYMLLKERAKNSIVKEYMDNEMANLQSFREELLKDRERYSKSTEIERKNAEEATRLEQKNQELRELQENILDMIVKHEEQIDLGRQDKNLNNNIPALNMRQNELQRQVLLANRRHHLASSTDSPLKTQESESQRVNPYKEIIAANNPTDMTKVISQFKQDLNNLQAKHNGQILQDKEIDIVDRLQMTFNRLHQILPSGQSKDTESSRLSMNPLQHQSFDEKNLHTLQSNIAEFNTVSQMRKLVLRDAYFLQKEKDWLEQEKNKLKTRMLFTDKKSRKSGLSNESPYKSFKSQSPNFRQLKTQQTPELQKQPVLQMFDVGSSTPPSSASANSKEKTNSLDIQSKLNQLKGGNTLRSDETLGLRAVPSQSTNQNDLINIQENYENPESSPQAQPDAYDELQKIELMRQNLEAEREYNADFNEQLNVQMEQARLQNEKLIQSENQMNEMKLKMLLKFDQIKLLEDFYNYHHADDPEKQIHLDVEVDERQLKIIVEKLHSQNQELRSMVRKRRKVVLFRAQEILSALTLRKLKANLSIFDNKRFAFMAWRITTAPKERIQYMTEILNNMRQKNGINNLNSSVDEVSQMDRTQQHYRSLNSTQFLNSEAVGISNFSQIHTNQLIDHSDNKANTQIIQSLQTQQIDGDWFQVYWQKKSIELGLENLRYRSPEQLHAITTQFKLDVEKYWKFRCQNILKLVTLHMRRRKRMLLMFGFQRYKAQSMRFSSVKMIKEKQSLQNFADQVQAQANLVASERAHSVHQSFSQNVVETHKSVNPYDQTQTPLLVVENADQRQLSERAHNDDHLSISNIVVETRSDRSRGVHMNKETTLMGAKKTALLMMLTQRNEKYGCLRAKNKAFQWWKGQLQYDQNIAVRLEVGRLASEVDHLRYQEQVLVTNFNIQKAELDSKLVQLTTYLQIE